MDYREHLAKHLPSDLLQGYVEALSLPSVHALILNTEKISDGTFLRLFPNALPHPYIPHCYTYDEKEYALGKSLYHALGAYYIMDPSAMMVPYMLHPLPGERILDLCGAPGGKSVFASMAMGNKGVLLCNDLSYSRALEASSNVERMGRGNIAVTSGDFAVAKDAYQGYFDAILLDVPCSGSAMFRKEPKMALDWSEGKVLSLAPKQRELLEIASTMLAPGGRIAYSTCSFSYEEDEGVLCAFLKDHSEFEAVSLPGDPSFYHHPDLPQGIRLFPHRFLGEGQFLCLLRHKGEKRERNEEKVHPLPKGYPEELVGFDYHKINDLDYALSMPLRINNLSLLRYGVKLSQKEQVCPLDHALASFLPASLSIPLDEPQAKAYLRGETFPVKEKDGLAIVSYQGMNMGYVKIVQGTAKNHYPKGLRRAY